MIVTDFDTQTDVTLVDRMYIGVIQIFIPNGTALGFFDCYGKSKFGQQSHMSLKVFTVTLASSDVLRTVSPIMAISRTTNLYGVFADKPIIVAVTVVPLTEMSASTVLPSKSTL